VRFRVLVAYFIAPHLTLQSARLHAWFQHMLLFSSIPTNVKSNFIYSTIDCIYITTNGQVKNTISSLLQLNITIHKIILNICPCKFQDSISKFISRKWFNIVIFIFSRSIFLKFLNYITQYYWKVINIAAKNINFYSVFVKWGGITLFLYLLL
jgi:hypothetical protein